MVGKSGPKQHRTPATLIAGFADTVRTPRRNSLIRVRRRDGSSGQVPASKLTIGKKAFDFDQDPDLIRFFGGTIDTVWSTYESYIAPMIDDMRSSSGEFHATAAAVGLGQLLPLLAGALVRGLDYDDLAAPGRFAKTGTFQPLSPADNLTLGRRLDWDEMSARLFHAQFRIVHALPGNTSLITNDLGYAVHNDLGQSSLLFPLCKETLLICVSGDDIQYSYGKRPEDVDQKFHMTVHSMEEADVKSINSEIATYAWREIYGQESALNQITFDDIRKHGLVHPSVCLSFNKHDQLGCWQEKLTTYNIAHVNRIPTIVIR